MRIAPLTPQTAAAFRQLFEACGCACYCRYWHFEGTKAEWLARFEHPQTNADEQLALVERGAPQARGLLAFGDGSLGAEDRALGWMKLAPRATLVKLRTQGAYRRLDLGDDEGVFSIGCLLVDPAHRRRGVARALVGAAAAYVRSWGGRAVEAYPHRASYALRDEEAFMGPERLFAEQGYVATHGEGPYPVYRRQL